MTLFSEILIAACGFAPSYVMEGAKPQAA